MPKPLSDYYLKAHSKPYGKCKACYGLVVSAYRKANPDLLREKQRKWWSANPERTKEQKLKSNYGLSLVDWTRRLKQQNGVCSICREAPPTCVDHDHSCCPGVKTCGRCVRALLCSACNKGLGNFLDQPERLMRAAEYVRTRGFPQ